MSYKLKGLKTGDIFKMSVILEKLNLKMDFKGKDQDQIGGELILAIGANIYKAEDEISELIGRLAGISKEEFLDLPLDELVNLLKQLTNIKGIKDFFNSAGQSTKQN